MAIWATIRFILLFFSDLPDFTLSASVLRAEFELTTVWAVISLLLFEFLVVVLIFCSFVYLVTCFTVDGVKLVVIKSVEEGALSTLELGFADYDFWLRNGLHGFNFVLESRVLRLAEHAFLRCYLP